MLNRTSLPNAFVTGLEEPAPAPLFAGRWRQWAFGLHLPSSLQGYLFFVFCLLILAFTMALHVTLSAERMRLDQRLSDLKEEYARTERINANLVWEISQSTSLATVHAEALRRGYIPLEEFKYVVTGPSALGPDAAFSNAGAQPAPGGWTVEPSAENPVVILTDPAASGDVPAAGTLQEATLAPQGTQAIPFDTPAMQMQMDPQAPAWRNPFSLEGLRAAAGETMNWLQDRLPRRR
jgi:hypothetical protein